MEPTPDNSLLSQPHIVACLYDDDPTSKRVFDDLLANQCTNAGVMRFGLPGDGGRKIVAVCADDNAAAMYSARLPWGPGTPIHLSDEERTVIAVRRSEGSRLASTHPTEKFVRRDIAQTLTLPHAINRQIVQTTALNSDAQPWPTGGGICGAVCPSVADATRVHEAIVAEHRETLEGMVTVFGNDDRAVAVVVADTPETNALGAETLLRLAGNLVYQPDAHTAWSLWAMRIRAGSAPLPTSGQGQAAYDFLTGKGTAQRIKVHAPTRNQPCPCGSGSKYKRCCGR